MMGIILELFCFISRNNNNMEEHCSQNEWKKYEKEETPKCREVEEASYLVWR